jgi:hypothetical protein
MKAVVAVFGVILAFGAATLLAQDAPQLTPRVTDKSPSGADVGARAVSHVVPAQNSSSGTKVSVTVAAGTRVPLILKQGITTRNARPGDPVYAQTSFPITMNNRIVIPPGTFVQGEIRRVQRPGRVKGHAELQISFTSMIFPNGYTLLLPGAVQGTPGDRNTAGVKDKEGTIEGDSSKGKDAGTVVGTAVPGAGIGAIAGGAKGAGIGALSGGALGLATVLLSRGPEIQLGPGDSIEMVLERSLTIDMAKARGPAQ